MTLWSAWLPRLRQFREHRGETAKAVGERAGLTRQAISGFERGTFTPSVPTLLSLLQALEVTPGQFFTPTLESTDGHPSPPKALRAVREQPAPASGAPKRVRARGKRPGR